MRLTMETVGADDVIQPNGGVFAFRRNERTQSLMRSWNKEWGRFAMRDQAALMRCLYTAPIRLLLLGLEWNTITRYAEVEQTAGILHHPMRARRWQGMIKGRLDSGEAWAAVHPKDFRDG
jgi:hypothetical protein